MLVTLPISELIPGMYVNSVTKQQESVDGIKIKTSGLVRDKSIIQRLILVFDSERGRDDK